MSLMMHRTNLARLIPSNFALHPLDFGDKHAPLPVGIDV